MEAKQKCARINITIASEIASTLEHLASKTSQSMASVVRSLVIEALDAREIKYTNAVINSIESNSKGYLTIPYNPIVKNHSARFRICFYRIAFEQYTNSELKDVVDNIIAHHLVVHPENMGKSVVDGGFYRRIKLNKLRIIYKVEMEEKKVIIIGIFENKSLLNAFNDMYI